jgi:Ca2+/H+ antiporter, TMEM165/GDT1 family
MTSLVALLPGSATSATVLFVAVFGACAVEMVEALTLVVAAGSSRSWRSALEGTAAALVLLGVLTAAVGAPLAHYLPIDALRVTVGALLLLMGISWLRKAILRGAGKLAKHDEDAIFARTVGELAAQDPVARGRDGVAFAVAFKGVMLEGFEVVLIVISLGLSSRRLGLAVIAAASAILIVAGLGVVLARQLSEVPENSLKTVVGVMLVSFGTFWIGEGAGVHWPGTDLSLPALIAIFAATTAALVGGLKRESRQDQPKQTANS